MWQQTYTRIINLQSWCVKRGENASAEEHERWTWGTLQLKIILIKVSWGWCILGLPRCSEIFSPNPSKETSSRNSGIWFWGNSNSATARKQQDLSRRSGGGPGGWLRVAMWTAESCDGVRYLLESLKYRRDESELTCDLFDTERVSKLRSDRYPAVVWLSSSHGDGCADRRSAWLGRYLMRLLKILEGHP